MNRPLTTSVADNLLSVSWHDSTWVPILNASNVMEYFCQASNPFYERTCNNEIIKMQRVNPEQLQSMTGVEYVLLHIQEPILYVIRKQHRHSPQQITPLSDYHIIAGTIYQAPDLASILNTRLLSTSFHLLSSFEEAISFARYHPSKGYFWDFKSTQKSLEKTNKTASSSGGSATVDKDKPKEESSSLFQRQRVEMLLGELIKKFPIPQIPQSRIAGATPPQIKQENENGLQLLDSKEKIDKDKVKPPPEKKPRLT